MQVGDAAGEAKAILLPRRPWHQRGPAGGAAASIVVATARQRRHGGLAVEAGKEPREGGDGSRGWASDVAVALEGVEGERLG